MPIIVGPTGFHGLIHDDGEIATARAAEKMGAVYIYNYMYSTRGVEAVAKECSKKWVQVYIFQDRALTLQAIADAERLGFAAIVVTCDHPHDRVRNHTMPHFQLKGNRAFLESRMRFPNSDRLLGGRTETVGVIDPGLTWDALAWLAKQTTLPVVAKGILSPDDARLAVQHGARGIVVSSHGFRQFGCCPSLRALPAVVAAVGPDVPVLFDSGIRCGSHVTKALALGARAVMVGRPVLWGLVHGAAGVEEVLAILRGGLKDDMASLGCTRLGELPQRLAPWTA
jgi:4-hydroxymandelate oxidase